MYLSGPEWVLFDLARETVQVHRVPEVSTDTMCRSNPLWSDRVRVTLKVQGG